MPVLIRNPKDFWSGVIFMAVGLAAVLIGRDYSMGSATKMGPAYFPTALGMLLALIGLGVVVRSLIQRGGPAPTLAYKPLALVVGSTVLFGLLLRGLGLAAALVVLAVVSAAASRQFSWGPALLLAVGLAVFSVLIFVKALGLPIPVLGTWLGA
jgi:putative tricarboxylic transport membrane protein